MASQTYSYTTSSSYSSRTSSHGQTTGQAYQQTTHSDPSGSRVQTRSQNLGNAAVEETRYFDSQGREVFEDGKMPGISARETGRIQDVEDVEEEQSKK